MFRISIADKIGLTAVIIASFSLALTTALNYFKFETTLTEQVNSRFVVVGFDLKRTIETGVNLGVALAELKNTQNTIERVKGQDQQILSVEVFEPEGQVLFSTEAERVGVHIAEHWLRAHRAEIPWNRMDQDAFVLGMPLVNDFGQTIGGLALRYSKSYHEAKLETLLVKLAKDTLLVLGGFAVVAIILIRLCLGQLSHSFRRMHRLLTDFESNPQTFDKADSSELEQHFARFQLKSEEVLDIQNQIEQELRERQKS